MNDSGGLATSAEREGSQTPDSEAKKAWNKANKWTITLNIMRRTEPDILAKLESVPDRSRYIKDLIRKDIAASVTSADKQ